MPAAEGADEARIHSTLRAGKGNLRRQLRRLTSQPPLLAPLLLLVLSSTVAVATASAVSFAAANSASISPGTHVAH